MNGASSYARFSIISHFIFSLSNVFVLLIFTEVAYFLREQIFSNDLITWISSVIQLDSNTFRDTQLVGF